MRRATLAALIQSLAADRVGVSSGGRTTAVAPACRDEHESCGHWAEKGECTANPSFMHTSCRSSCFVCQSSTCRNDDESCSNWAADGECARNEGYMLEHCAFACRTCFTNQTRECRRPADLVPAAAAGTIDATFERLVSSPRAPRVLSRSPWVLAFDDFLSDAEADALVAAAGHNFEASRFLGDDLVARDGLVRNRTSTTSWCNVPSCLRDPTFLSIRTRISELMGVPWENSEHLQLLRYQEGQFYREHHDQIAPPDSAWGPRLFTFFMYLSDVSAGGETAFTRLGIEVAPRKGRAIVWPSVLSDDLRVTDERTYHEALPVVSGLKYAANFWIHLYDFQNFHARGCENRNYLQTDALARLSASAAASSTL